jgi:AraC-like DNA-binding protein
MSRRMQTRILLRNEVETPLGRLTLAGSIRDGLGVVPAYPLRVYGSYAVMYLLEGRGVYRDANGRAQNLRAGDLVVVFPELAHTYGPAGGERWSEFYLVFDGPVFDLWRQVGLLDSARPVYHIEPVDGWFDRFKALVEGPRPVTPTERVAELCRFLQILGEVVGENAAPAREAREPRWLSRACSLLETDLGEEIDLEDVAQQVGLSYENFRKRFQQQVGISPARYRAARRIDAARELLRYTQMTNRQVAESLGFSDEFYFSKRFKQITGMTPRAFRQSLPQSRRRNPP